MFLATGSALEVLGDGKTMVTDSPLDQLVYFALNIFRISETVEVLMPVLFPTMVKLEKPCWANEFTETDSMTTSTMRMILFILKSICELNSERKVLAQSVVMTVMRKTTG